MKNKPLSVAERQKKHRSKIAKQIQKARKVVDAQYKLSQAYEEMAHALGYKNWKVASSQLWYFPPSFVQKLIEQNKKEIS